MKERRRDYGRAGDGTFGGCAKGSRTNSKYLLSGFLECAECGGGFFAVTRGTDYGCGLRRDRGPDICGDEVRIHRTDLEDRARVVEIDSELENLVGLVAKLGDLDAYARVIEQLREEKCKIEQRLHAHVTPIEASPQRLRQLVTERVMDLRKTFEGEPQGGIRAALQELLRGRRLRVGPDAERGFRVEGLFEWLLQTKAARPHWENRRLASVVAGGRYDRSESARDGILVRLTFAA